MAKYSGSALFMDWNGVTISAEFRTLDVTDDMNLIDSTAGSDQYAEHVNGIGSLEASISLIWNGTAGSAVQNALKPGTFGTLTFAPIGTASSNPKYSFAGTVKTNNTSTPYQDMISNEITITGFGEWIEHYEYLGTTY